MTTVLDLSYRLVPAIPHAVLYHYRCGRLTYGANDIYWRRCGACYREALETTP